MEGLSPLLHPYADLVVVGTSEGRVGSTGREGRSLPRLPLWVRDKDLGYHHFPCPLRLPPNVNRHLSSTRRSRYPSCPPWRSGFSGPSEKEVVGASRLDLCGPVQSGPVRFARVTPPWSPWSSRTECRSPERTSL